MTQEEAIRQLAKAMDTADVIDLNEDEAEAMTTARIVFKELERRDIRLVSVEETVLSRGLTEALMSVPPHVPAGGVRFLEEDAEGETK